MADKADRVIVIGDGDWQIADTAPVVFRRTELAAPIPQPVRGGDIDKLWQHINVSETDRPVLLAVKVAAWVQPNAPHVILGLLAEYGSAKSTLTKRIVDLVDPSIAPLSMPPRDVDQWVTSANGSWIGRRQRIQCSAVVVGCVVPGGNWRRADQAPSVQRC